MTLAGPAIDALLIVPDFSEVERLLPYLALFCGVWFVGRLLNYRARLALPFGKAITYSLFRAARVYGYWWIVFEIGDAYRNAGAGTLATVSWLVAWILGYVWATEALERLIPGFTEAKRQLTETVTREVREAAEGYRYPRSPLVLSE